MSPKFAALMEENGGSLTNGETKGESQEHRETCNRGDKEMSQDASGMDRKHKIRKVLRGVLSDCESANHDHRETCVASLMFDPIHSKVKGGTLVIEKISAKCCDMASAYCSVHLVP